MLGHFFYIFFCLMIYPVFGERSECECVPFYLCNNGTINSNGLGLIDIRMGPAINIRYFITFVFNTNVRFFFQKLSYCIINIIFIDIK